MKSKDVSVITNSLFSGCDVTYTQEYGEIFTPGYGVVNYANKQTCTWKIDIPGGKALSIHFEPGFQIEDGKDYLQVSSWLC